MQDPGRYDPTKPPPVPPQPPYTPPASPPHYPPPGYPSALQAPPGVTPQQIQNAASNKIAAGICGLLLGSIGVHKFILGYTSEGIIMAAVSVLTCGFASPIMGIIGLIEGIIYLSKSDTDFAMTYVFNRKGWF